MITKFSCDYNFLSFVIAYLVKAYHPNSQGISLQQSQWKDNCDCSSSVSLSTSVPLADTTLRQTRTAWKIPCTGRRNLQMGMVISTWEAKMYPTTIATSTWSSTKLSLKKRSLPVLIHIFPLLPWKTSRILHLPWYSEQSLCHSFFSPLLTTENLFKIIWKKSITWKQPPSFLLCQRKLESNNITSGIRLGQAPALASYEIKPHNFI